MMFRGLKVCPVAFRPFIMSFPLSLPTMISRTNRWPSPSSILLSRLDTASLSLSLFLVAAFSQRSPTSPTSGRFFVRSGVPIAANILPGPPDRWWTASGCAPAGRVRRSIGEIAGPYEGCRTVPDLLRLPEEGKRSGFREFPLVERVGLRRIFTLIYLYLNPNPRRCRVVREEWRNIIII